jgi:Spy/CpxP family protein refolding chaperone
MFKKMILVVVLVALVAGTQVFAADEPAAPKAPAPARERTMPAAPGGAGGMGGMRGMGMGGMGVWGVVQQLTGLTEEQKTKVTELRTATMEKMQSSGAGVMAAQMKVMELVNAGGSDADITAAVAEYTKSYTAQQIQVAAAMRDLRTNILKPEQVTELDKLMKERAAQFSGRGMGMGGQGGQGGQGGRQRGNGAAGAEGAAAPKAPKN